MTFALSLVDRARLFATGAHAGIGQRRKYTHRPYITHCKAVADLVQTVPHDAAVKHYLDMQACD